MVRVPTDREHETQELGRLLKQARARRRQQEIAAQAGISDSTLSRFEKGNEVPDLDQARRLDTVLGTGTAVQDRVQRILFQRILFQPEQGVLRVPRRLSVHVFPPPYVGAIYVQLTAPGPPVTAVRVALVWGPWSHVANLPTVDTIGTALVAAKVEADDTRGTPLRVHTSVPLNVAFGCGHPDLPDDRVHDANGGWFFTHGTTED